MAKLMKDFIRIENNFTIIPNDILIAIQENNAFT